MSTGYRPLPPEPEALPVRKIVLAGAATLFLFAISSSIAWWMARGSESTIPQDLGKPEINRIYQRPFVLENTARELSRQQRERLQGWGWVDRREQLIHIPIDRAIDELVAAERKEATR